MGNPQGGCPASLSLLDARPTTVLFALRDLQKPAPRPPLIIGLCVHSRRVLPGHVRTAGNLNGRPTKSALFTQGGDLMCLLGRDGRPISSYWNNVEAAIQRRANSSQLVGCLRSRAFRHMRSSAALQTPHRLLNAPGTPLGPGGIKTELQKDAVILAIRRSGRMLAACARHDSFPIRATTRFKNCRRVEGTENRIRVPT